MVDVHCHILPGVDDGADSLQTSMIMAAMAADEGITDIIATPHVFWNKNYTTDCFRPIRNAMDRLQTEICRAHIPVTIHLGAEVLCAEPAPELLKKGIFPCIEGTNFALVEFWYDEFAEKITASLHALQDVGITPVVAHPERYKAVQNQKNLAKQWKNMGILLQINTGSLYGLFGKKAKRTAMRMLDDGLSDMIATDAHDIRRRSIRIAEAQLWIAKYYGEDQMYLLTTENPLRLLNNQPLNNTYKIK